MQTDEGTSESGLASATSDPEISVIIPVFNAGSDLVEQLRALDEQHCATSWEVVVADNGSTDGSRQIAEAWCAEHRRFSVVDASTVRGAPAARNAGVAASRGELLLFCDSDDVVLEGWIEACATALRSADLGAGYFDFHLLNGKMRASQGRSAGVTPLGFMPSGLGANLSVRRSAFEAIGGFDEALVLGDDTDLCWRLQLAGYRFTTIPDALVAKRARTTVKGIYRQTRSYGLAGPVLYRRYRSHGLRRDVAGALKIWLWLLVFAPLTFQPERRFEWARAAGTRVGRLQGSWRTKTFFP